MWSYFLHILLKKVVSLILTCTTRAPRLWFSGPVQLPFAFWRWQGCPFFDLPSKDIKFFFKSFFFIISQKRKYFINSKVIGKIISGRIQFSPLLIFLIMCLIKNAGPHAMEKHVSPLSLLRRPSKLAGSLCKLQISLLLDFIYNLSSI